MCRSFLSELLVYYFSITQDQIKKEMCTKDLLRLLQFGLKQSTPFVVQAIPQASQANPEVTFNGQWLAEKISYIIDSLIEIRLSVRGIVTDNHSANVNAFSALLQTKIFNSESNCCIKHPQNSSKTLILWDCSSYEKHQKYVICCSAGYIRWVDLYSMTRN